MDEVRWGILGAGAVAALFAEDLALVRGARLAAVGDVDRARAESFAARFGARRAHPGCEELVRDPEVDVVYVATRSQDHAAHCLLAIEAGKAVLCEKPFALDAPSGARVVEAARERRVFCMEGMWMRFAPAVREALAAVRDGRLGRIRMITAQLGFPHRPDPSNRLFAAPGGGALLDLGVYALSLVQAVVGNVRPRSVSSLADLFETGVDEQVSATLRYGEDCQATVLASVRSLLANEASIHGTAGVVRLRPLWFPDHIRMVTTPPQEEVGSARPGALRRLRRLPWARALAELPRRLASGEGARRVAGMGYAEEAREVCRCVREGLTESPELPLAATLAVLETLDAIRGAWTAGG